MEWQIATQTHVGKVRSINEDALLVVKDYPLFTVADGMGGHQAGEVASQMIIDDQAKLSLGATLGHAQVQIERTLLHTNQQIVDYGKRELAGVTVGSTVVTMIAQDHKAVCIWAGDSRLYRVRDHKLEQLTEDHSYVAELLRDGLISEEEARHHPSANMITRAIGVVPNVALSVKAFDVYPGDSYLLCSDGLYNEVSDEELLQAIVSADVYRSSVQLLNLCLQRQARDNITFIIGHASSPSSDTLESEETQLDGSLTRLS